MTPAASTEIALSEDQQAAAAAVMAALREQREAVLTGPAGSGKTTLMRYLLGSLRAPGNGLRCGNPWVCAPTGKASRRISEVTGWPASTIHSLMYGAPSEDEDGKVKFTGRKDEKPGSADIVVVDEASMVGDKLAGDLRNWLRPATRILWVGDREQLEPVEGEWGVDFAKPTAALTQVHRQALDSPIIACATAVREGWGDRWMAERGLGDHAGVSLSRDSMAAVDWYLSRRDQDAAAITFTHRARKAFNVHVRRALGHIGPLAVGDRILIRRNATQLGLVNGDVLSVTGIRPCAQLDGALWVEVAGRTDELVVMAPLINADTSDWWSFVKKLRAEPWLSSLPFVYAWHGECLTVHASQGSQWDSAAFLWCPTFSKMRAENPEPARRLLYTAITRASRDLAIFAGDGW